MSEPKRTRLIFLGFAEEMVARDVLEVIKDGRSAKAITLDDWALVHKAPGGKLTITTDRSPDPGAARGAVAGGVAGMILATLAGPVGPGAVVGGAAVGAVSAAIRDAGLKNDDITEVSKFMADGRTGIMVTMPLAEADKWDAFVAAHVEFQGAERQQQADIVPGRTFEKALDDYRLIEEA